MSDRARLEASPVTPEQAATLIRGRRSVEQFEPEPPDEAWLWRALELARWAPNHHLTEPWRFYVLGPKARDAVIDLNARLVARAKTEAAGEAKRRRWQAVPGWFVLTCRVRDDALTAREDYAACACAAQNIMLYLHSAGIATKWTSGTVTREPAFLSLIGADANAEYTVGLFWYGYARRAPRSQRRDLDQIAARV